MKIKIMTFLFSFISITAHSASVKYYVDGSKEPSSKPPEYLTPGQQILIEVSTKEEDARITGGFVARGINRDGTANVVSKVEETAGKKIALAHTVNKDDLKVGYITLMAWFLKHKSVIYNGKNIAEIQNNTPLESRTVTIFIKSKKEIAREAKMTDEEKDARTLKTYFPEYKNKSGGRSR